MMARLTVVFPLEEEGAAIRNCGISFMTGQI